MNDAHDDPPAPLTPARAPSRRHAFAVAALALCAGLPGGAVRAENHALILWIGQYADSRNNLPGIDSDAALARNIAQAMGTPPGNVVEVSNAALTHGGFSRALADLASRIKNDDKVFIYYSGHGRQISNPTSASKCSEGLVSYDANTYFDISLQHDLERLAAKASQVVMLNDSCFSGGASKDGSRDADGLKGKFYVDHAKAGSANDDGYQCGNAVNKVAPALETASRGRATQVLYIAASADNEVSWASPKGSFATMAWAACMRSRAADGDRSGMVTGEELQRCSQSWLDANSRRRQTVTLHGNGRLPVSFMGPAAGGSTGAGSAAAPVEAAQTLQDLSAGADPSYRVTLNLSAPTLRIRQDYLDFSVSTNKPGFLYILQVGSDGRTFNVLFPNAQDGANQVGAGTHRFPRETWRLRAGGPTGTSYLMAYLSSSRKNLDKGMDTSQVFASAPANDKASRTLMVEATGAGGGSGRYGASAVVAVRETP